MNTYRLPSAWLPLPLLIIAGVFLLTTIFIVEEYPVLSIIVMVACTGVFSYRDGITINTAEKKYSNDTTVFFLRFHSWKPVSSDTVVGLRIVKLSYDRYSRANVQQSFKESTYE